MNLMSNKYQTPQQLREALQELKTQFPRLYPRDLAAKLGVSEAQLIALGAGEIAFAKTGIAFAFAVRAEKFVRRGLQFFDASGTAVLKAYLRDESKIEAFDAWIQSWLSTDQSDTLEVTPTAPQENPHAHSHTNCSCAHSSEKSQAIEAPAESFKLLLKAAVKSGEPVALSLANDTTLFRVRVPAIKKLTPMAPWFNILDDALHSHLREEAVVQAKLYTCKEKNELKLASLSQAGRTLFTLSVPLNGAAAREILPSGGTQ